MSSSREYKGFQINANATKSPRGGYVASVTLSRRSTDITFENKFEVPLDEELPSEDEALHEAVQYGLDLIDGLLPWFDPQSMHR